MRKLYIDIIMRVNSPQDFIQEVSEVFKGLGDNWKRPSIQDLMLFYRMNT